MDVLTDANWTAFNQALEQNQAAVRLKQIRAQAIERGRALLSLFELAPAGDRPHPRLRTSFAEVVDPSPPALPQPQAWSDAAEFRSWLAAAIADPALLAGLDNPPADSPRYWQNALRADRITALLDHARSALAQLGGWSATERQAAQYAIAELGALAYAGAIQFDDEDMGTYFSFLYDQPFVHVLEQIRASLPNEGTEAFALLPSEEQASVRRQHAQIDNHLDFLMRHKYAFTGITETDIERTLGGFLIDRQTRQIASEDPVTLGSLRPRHQLLRIDPASNHPQAGAWIMRTATGLALPDGTPVEVPDDQLRATPIPQARLTFQRAPGDPKLREGLRFDWNGDGWVDSQPIPWISWAGHCDIQAVLEQLGLALLDQPSVFEYRSDTGEVTELTRDLLLELLAAVVELGSVYERMDGTGRIVRGIQNFGGARNDSLPDRLQFQGPGPGQHFRWPLSREREALEVTQIVEDGVAIALDTAFARCLPDLNALEFSANPRYLGTVDGDYNLINATGMVVSATVRVSSFDAAGNLVRDELPIVLDLRPEASGRSFLGTHLHDAGARELYRVYLDRAQPQIVAELWRWDPSSGDQTHDPSRDVVLPLAATLSTTVSREQQIDDPEAFNALIELALQEGQNICADTDFEAPVWNGVVTRLQVERLAVNEAARVERWRLNIEARFGVAAIEYLVRRTPEGAPEAYCPIADGVAPPPDFLYQDLPDIASKGVEQGAWVVNEAMRARGIVEVRWAPHEQGGWYVEDDHIKNAFELLYVALAGYRWTIVHQNKRYVFATNAEWTAAQAELDGLREQLSFE